MKKLLLILMLSIIGCTSPRSSEIALLLPKGDLNPFLDIPIEKIHEVSRSQYVPNSEFLNQAWFFYRQFQGSWVPNAPKPNQNVLAEFEQFSKRIKSSALPSWVNQNDTSDQQALVFDTNNPIFQTYIQTPETQFVKSLSLVLLTEHELNLRSSLSKAADLLYRLIHKTPFDSEVRFLFAKMGFDVNDNLYSFYNVRIGLYLLEQPAERDLDFFCYSGLLAAKDRWEDIQSIVRHLSSDPQIADKIITKYYKYYTSKLKRPSPTETQTVLFPRL